jgi:hypothetical protein
MSWIQKYKEMGSRDKKTGKLKYYIVTSYEHKSFSCECPAGQFRRYSECKHIKRLREKLCI